MCSAITILYVLCGFESTYSASTTVGRHTFISRVNGMLSCIYVNCNEHDLVSLLVTMLVINNIQHIDFKVVFSLG